MLISDFIFSNGLEMLIGAIVCFLKSMNGIPVMEIHGQVQLCSLYQLLLRIM